MAQIIRHRRGSLEALSAATSSFQKGELIIVSGSSNITTTNGSGMVFAAVESGSIQAVNRFMIGDNAPNTFASSTYNGLVKGVPYYASGSSTLYLLGSDGNDIPDLTGNISNFSASVVTSFSASNASITALSASVASVTGDFSSSVATSFSASNAELVALSASVASVTGDFSSSVAETFTTQSQRISSLESFTGSYATTGSNVFKGEQIISSSLIVTNEIKGTGSIFLQPDVDDSRKLEIYNTSVSDVHIKATGGQTFLGDDTNFVEINDSLQIINITAVNGVFVTGIEETIGEFSQSVDSRFSASVASVTSLSASVASVTGDFSSSVATSFSQSNASIVALSASVASVTGDFSSSVATSFSASAYNVSASNASQDIRIDQLASFTGSYATTGSNIFFGTQTFTGSVYITQDLIVQGSSSLQNVTASAVSIGTNQINLNTDFPAFRYAGLNVYDSGSSGVSASLQWDSLNDQWIFVHRESGSATVDSSILLYGPLSTGGLGTETGLTGNFLTKIENNGHGHHLTTSSIEDTGTNVSIHNSLDVTGSLNIKDSAATFSIVGNGFSETYLQGNGGIVLQAGGPGVQIKSNNLEVQGTISGTTISGSSITGLGNATEYSQSVSASLASITANVGAGVGVSITNLNSFTSSQLTQNSDLATYTASVETRLTEIGTVSGSLIASASTAKTTNDTQDTRLTNIESFSASVNTSISNLNSTSESVNTSVAALNSSSASQQVSIDALNTVSGSNLIRLTNLESTSASVNTSITNINSFSSSVLTQLTEIGIVSGSLIASASTAKTTNDTQDGRLGELESKSASVDISIAALNSYTSSNTSTNALNAFTASAETRFTEIGVVSGSLIESASAAKTTNDAQDVSITNLNTFSASVNTSVSALNSSSASQQVSIDALNTVSGSNLIRLSNLESTSASVNISVSNINTFTSSADIRLTNLESTSASVNISVSNLNSTTASLNTSVAELNSYSSSLKTAFEFTGSNVVVLGDLTVKGTTTSVESTTIQLGDNIIELNGSGVANGGLLVKDPTSPNTVSGSLLWDSTNDYWKAGASGAESKVALMGGDNLVTSSQQILLTQVDGYETFSGSVATSISASVAGATWDNLVGKPGGLVSGSIQVDITETTGYSTFSSSIETRISLIDGGTY
jgi:uncharacterized coiled-coil protein SlyX